VWRRDRGKKPHAEPAVSPTLHGARSNGGILLLLVLLAFDAAILAWILPSSSPMIYSRSIPTLLQDFPRRESGTLRTEGALVHQSLYRLRQGCEFRFRLGHYQDSSSVIDVRYRPDLGYVWSRAPCALPDTFCDTKEMDFSITVEGRLARDASGFYFAATQVMSKCPSKYEIGRYKNWPACPPVPVRG
jgi:cytochrome c-type biogenesis protein CcmE